MRIKLRRLTWHNSSQSDQQLREYLILALLRSRACVTLQDSSLNYLFIANLPRVWTVEADTVPDDVQVFGEALGRRLIEVKKSVIATGAPVTLETGEEPGRVFEVHVEAVRTQDESRQILTTIVDITQTRRREQALKDLLREVSHRSRNLLAVIQGLATQSARTAETLEEFVSDFRGRIFSLAGAQDLVTEADWFGVRLKDLVESQAALVDASMRPKISFTGDNVLLTPNAALYMGLGFHELLHRGRRLRRSAHPGAVRLSCRQEQGEGRSALRLSWVSDFGGDAEASSVAEAGEGARFSSLLLEQIVPQSLSGKAGFHHGETSEEYRLIFPETEYNVRRGLSNTSNLFTYSAT